MSHAKITLILVALMAGALALWILLWFHEPSVEFESSDRLWHGQEDLFKGGGFDSVVYQFEEYKLRCNKENVTLLRVTPKDPWNVLAWPSYLTNEKWRTEYRDVSRLPPITSDPACNSRQSNKLSQNDEEVLLQRAVNRFLAELRTTRGRHFFEK